MMIVSGLVTRMSDVRPNASSSGGNYVVITVEPIRFIKFDCHISHENRGKNIIIHWRKICDCTEVVTLRIEPDAFILPQ
jgi:hypothetical protein